MDYGWLIVFAAMVVPGLIAVAIASTHWMALLWNFTWFLIFARVGLEAFGSAWGAFPALVFVVNYAMRAMRPRTRPAFNFKFRNFGAAPPSPSSRPEPREVKVPDTIEAEFRREPD